MRLTMAPGPLRAADGGNNDTAMDGVAHDTGLGGGIGMGDSPPTNNGIMQDERLTMLRSMPEAPAECQVCVVGAGPAGLMLATNLARFGVKVLIVDDRADQTPVGR